MSTALTAQDPYSLPPQEQARYEGLFSQYAKEDGFVYGAEAVALFSKSGLQQAMLRDIWNMVDTPVDNRLDKLEFAMAMHLIVCVSKKNLPMPPGLPMSLKGLKAQQAHGNMMNASPAMNSPPQMPQMAGSNASIGSGMGPPPPSSNMSVASGMHPPQIHDSPPTEIHAAPPIRPAGGMGISDAFEGLSTGGGGSMSGPPPITRSSLPEPGSFATASSLDHGAPAVSTIPDPEPYAAAAPSPSPPPMEKPKTTKELASSYEMGDTSAELEKLKTMLQKLQAENISLKASLGTMTEEEKEVQKEISATVAEIGKLSNELTSLRAKVLAAKSALLEATAELKGHHEKKAMITDLIGETQATKEAIDSALEGVREAENMNEQPAAHNAPTPSYEADLFGGFDSPAPAPAPQQMTSHSLNAPSISNPPTTDEDEPANGVSNNAAPPAATGFVQTVTSSDDEDAPPAARDAPIAMFSNASPAIRHKTMSDASHPGLAASPSAAEVENAKEMARKAEQTAREAEETRRSLAEQAEDLRKLSEQAENELRDMEAHAGHKKNPLRIGAKRKEMRGVEKAKQDAAEKKKQYMDLQAQVNNATTLALETRREADRLSQEAEQKEIEAAQAASLSQNQPVEQNGGGYGFAAPPVHNGGFGAPPANGGSGYTPIQGTHRKQSSDYGDFGGGFGIMGGTSGDGAAWGIPSPTGSEHGDAMANPF
jgi:cob(I)alamin adenosyltransferase